MQSLPLPSPSIRRLKLLALKGLTHYSFIHRINIVPFLLQSNVDSELEFSETCAGLPSDGLSSVFKILIYFKTESLEIIINAVTLKKCGTSPGKQHAVIDYELFLSADNLNFYLFYSVQHSSCY